MKTAKFIKSLEVIEVPCKSYHEYSTYDLPSLHTSDGHLLFTDTISTTKRIVPIIEICKPCGTSEYGNHLWENMYVAYSKEVEDLLGIPISIIVEENKNLREENDLLELQKNMANGLVKSSQKELNYINKASLWERIKFVFGVKITSPKKKSKKR